MSLARWAWALAASERCDWSLSSVPSALAALGGPTEEELLELLDQCDLALTRTPDSTPRASTCRLALLPLLSLPPFELVSRKGQRSSLFTS